MRARKRGETATVFLPSVAPLLALANTMEEERDHALDRPASDTQELYDPEAALLAAANREDKASDSLVQGSFEMLESQASFDRVLFDGGEFGLGADVGSAEEQDFLGLPGLLDADQVTTLLRQRQHQQSSTKTQNAERSQMDHRAIAELRRELNKLVNAWARKTGQPHGTVHNELRRRSGALRCRWRPVTS